MKCIRETSIDDALSLLCKSSDVFAPVQEGNNLFYRLLPAEGHVRLGPSRTLLPLKSLFLPAVEDLLAFSGSEGHRTLKPTEPLERDRVVFGALGCDIKALDLLDSVLLGEPPDEAYRERRERTAIVAVACTGEGPECFCRSFGIDPLRPRGADVILTGVGGAFLIEAVTGSGKRIVGLIEKYTREATDEEIAAAGAVTADSRDDTSAGEVPVDFAALWESDIWSDLAARCIGCGICTLLCPTCYCFDVRDESSVDSGRRFKTWDSCMFSSFTKMAGGLNPRNTKRQRVRQRFLHKLSYYPSMYGSSACVGCGRCTVYCPVGIGMDEVIMLLASAGVHGG
jgi:sulfhydrogenase subunit beta (sulfur reductase)